MPKTEEIIREAVISQRQADRMARYRRGDTVTGRTVMPSPPVQVPKSASRSETIDITAFGKPRISEVVTNVHGSFDYSALEKRMLSEMMARQDEDFRRYLSMGYQLEPHPWGESSAMTIPALPKRGLNGPRDIPATWKSALREIQSIFPHAALVGGALRDRDHGVKVKDLDIFIEASEPTYDALCAAQNLLEEKGFQTKLVDTSVYKDWFGVTKIVGIVETAIGSCPPIQLIFCDFPVDETLLYRLDFGCCQIMYDGRQIKRTDAYEFDRRRKLFRLVTGCDSRQMVRRLERWARLREKYPEWELDLGVMAPDYVVNEHREKSDRAIQVMHGV